MHARIQSAFTRVHTRACARSLAHAHAGMRTNSRAHAHARRVATRNYELDSHCYHLELHYLYWRHSGDASAILSDLFVEVLTVVPQALRGGAGA
jgi:meiotically up-regulated gene 157 (Mug157) protein